MDLHADSANNMSLHTDDNQSHLSSYDDEYSEYDNYSYYYGDYYGYDYDYTEDKVAEVINYVSIIYGLFSNGYYSHLSAKPSKPNFKRNFPPLFNVGNAKISVYDRRPYYFNISFRECRVCNNNFFI